MKWAMILSLILSFSTAAFSNEKVDIFNDKFYRKPTQKAFVQFQKDAFKDSDQDFDIIFLKIEKKILFQSLKQSELMYFDFQNLTNVVVRFVGELKNNYRLPFDHKKRAAMQRGFYGISEAIKKGSELNLKIQSEQFDKLHDFLVGQSTTLFYASFKEKRHLDLFWTAYFLHELNYPMDLTAKHLAALGKTLSRINDPVKYRLYGARLAKLSLQFGTQLNKPTQDQLDLLYTWALNQAGREVNQADLQHVQKLYLKQIQLLGNVEKIKEFKQELATNILIQETKKLVTHPLNIFKYIQFVIGYIFVAWPLEFILIFVSLGIFAVQSSIVLSQEEMRKAWIPKKVWRVFKKAYLGGGNVPFFSKLAASLILFGIGLYFNSAKNIVESLISNL